MNAGSSIEPRGLDTASLRKARGAFFTPPEITEFITRWAVRSAYDRVLEPSAGDAEFLIQAVNRLRSLAGASSHPEVFGVEIHAESAAVGRARVRHAGGVPKVVNADFFDYHSDELFDAVIGNPPFVRYQDFSGESRVKAREAALRSGVVLSKLASSWAAFVVHSASFLRGGGRLGFVLPAELLSVSYASPVRRFILESFAEVHLVIFEEQVFPDAEADVVLLLADGYMQGQSKFATVSQSRNAQTLADAKTPWNWSPPSRDGKWTSLLLPAAVREAADIVSGSVSLGTLGDWGTTGLGMVTGANHFFALSDERVEALGLSDDEVLPLSPPGSSHLRGLSFTRSQWSRLGAEGESRWLFRPDPGNLSAGARAHIEAGERAGVSLAYKCRIREHWWRVPSVRVADLLVTYMNAEAPRAVFNHARVGHLNSVHGFYLKPELRRMGRRYLPLLTLSSFALLSAEIEGRAYGGGLLKLEPREVRALVLPHPGAVLHLEARLDDIRSPVSRLLDAGRVSDASRIVDDVVMVEGLGLTSGSAEAVRIARLHLWERRQTRSLSKAS